MAGKYSGKSTKSMLADALLEKLGEGRPLSKIPIRELTDACGLDRQTFYYHFKNIYELMSYAYDRALTSLFEVDDPEDVMKFDWRYRAEHVLKSVEADPGLRDGIIPTIGEGPIRRYIHDHLENAFNEELVPKLIEAGQSEKEARVSTQMFSYSLQAVLIAWITHETDWSVEEILSEIERMLDDYLRGVSMRPAAR